MDYDGLLRRYAAAFRRLRETPNGESVLQRFVAAPDDIERIVRTDILMNEGEGEPSGLKVQLRVRDREGVKPYHILTLTADPLNGTVDFELRNDRGLLAGRPCSIEGLMGECREDDGSYDLESIAARVLLFYIRTMLVRDGFSAEAAIINVMTSLAEPIGWRTLTRLYHRRLMKMYRKAPPFDRSPFIRSGQMRPGEWYALTETVPIGVTVFHLIHSPQRVESVREDWFLARGEKNESLRLVLDKRSVVSGPVEDDVGGVICRDSDGKVFEVADELVADLKRFVSPKFDESTDVPIGMPVWDKTLDAVEPCLERLRTEKYGFDPEQHLQAVRFLVGHREDLAEDVVFGAPHKPGYSHQVTEDPAWAEIVAATEPACDCGVHRRIVAGRKSGGFKADTSRKTVLGPGIRLFLVPPGQGIDGALAMVRIAVRNGVRYLVFLDKPDPSAMGAEAPTGARVHKLEDVAATSKDAVLATGQSILVSGKDRDYFEIGDIDLEAGTVEIIPDETLFVINGIE